MNVVFMHYHFRSGGVTSVILRHIRCLKGIINPFLIVGEIPEVQVNIPYTVIPSLAYDRDRTDILGPEEIADKILKAVKKHFGSKADLYHIHNPTLGKNKNYIEVIDRIIEDGNRVLLHIHDFAEDGRADNYQSQPYPSNVHYAVLNKRDYRILKKSGLTSKGLHLIPNPVELPDKYDIDYPLESNNLILYPVRAIRRKNIGEAVLLSLFINTGDFIGITLEPTSRIDVVNYKKWIEFSKERGLPVKFGIGIDNDFMNLVKASKVMITTSIKEGFGMSFLEPWIFKRMLLGRMLTDICQDFLSKGIDLSYMYSSLVIPTELLEIERIKRRLAECYLKNLKSFGVVVDKGQIEVDTEDLFSGQVLDFGMLDEENQRQVISKLLMDDRLKNDILGINKKLSIFSMLNSSDFRNIIEKNIAIVEKEYSLKKIRGLLIDVYNSVLKDEVKHSIDKKILIEEFNSLERMSLLLCNETYDQ